jgi:uncharacterized membrane protein YsdA (DUF1294 family)
MKIILVYLLLINIIGIYIMYLDKRKAKKGYWRIPEATLFMVAALFGSVGILVGMRLYHHKTKHFKFVFGIPATLVVQAFLIYKLYSYFV